MAAVSSRWTQRIGIAMCMLVMFLAQPVIAEELVRIGVIAKRGHEITLERWQPTADYLTGQIPGYVFEILPLTFDQVPNAVEAGNVQFILVNASMYVQLEHDYGISRIATLKNKKAGKVFSTFGSVIFSHADKLQLTNISQLRNQHVAAVDKASLGGWHMAMKEMLDAGIDPHTDLASVSFEGTHDNVVQAVLNGRASIGIVRTDLLEKMAAEGKISLANISVLPPPQEQLNQFPFLLSTALYPEWPFSKVSYTSSALAEQVAAALLLMPTSGPTQAADIAGWTVPSQYRVVRELLQTLRLPPYDNYDEIRPSQIIEQYTYTVLTIALILFGMAAMLIRQHRLTHSLTQTQIKLADYSHRLSLATQAGKFGIWEWYSSSHSLVWDGRMHQLFALKEDVSQSLYQVWFDRIHPDDRAQIEHALLAANEQQSNMELEYRIVLPNEQVRVIKSACIVEPATTQTESYMVGVSWDITDSKQLEQEATQLAVVDKLTGCKTQLGFLPWATAEFERSQRYKTGFSILMIDIDDFKIFNDKMGITFGDRALAALADRIQKTLRSTDYLCRWGDDQFSALLLHTKAESAQVTAQRLCSQLQSTSIELNHVKATYTVSIGVAERSPTDQAVTDTLERAEQALQQAQALAPSKVVLAKGSIA
ncbi:PhnD/SsuA/transferrin family substrate-binding protein [Neiella marina]|uniref:diguanylate cyclase n=1 Tax=Neiella holothuriorum TaxID=2870530 RepID=A0ABS7ED77_9GAMM|nr:PhnD/SsuA/transferrin family substrate-binding protein [Neiella holothuriorum]MBW8189878.1 PhnD/SsuA/transferrin family substrate-binding protein [Neiella holothuriorum]